MNLGCVEDVWPANLPSLYRFSSGTIGYTIGDGGRDMFDNGNELRIRMHGEWSSPLYYTQARCPCPSGQRTQGPAPARSASLSPATEKLRSTAPPHTLHVGVRRRERGRRLLPG